MVFDENGEYKFEVREPIKGFPELRWTGKRPFKSTMYYPAQLKESYGTDVDGWMNKIFGGDNLQVMSHMLKEYRGKVQLVYIVIWTTNMVGALSSQEHSSSLAA